MKFLHTADWQIGMKAAHVGEAGEKVRQERLSAARRVMQAATAHAVDFVLLAGDTFEDNACDRVLVQQTVDILASCPVPVYVLPGNHDPLVPGSVWEHPAWTAASRVHILREDGVRDLPGGGLLYACPLREKYGTHDPTAWIDAATETRIAIGAAHGNVEGVQRGEAEYPIARDAASRRGLDYLALGHWHSTAIYFETGARMAYSGTHETTKFGEHDSGNVLVVEVTERGMPPVVTRVRTGGLTWLQRVAHLDGHGALDRLREEIETRDASDRTLLDLTLSGLFSANDIEGLIRIEEIVRARFLHARIDSASLTPEPADDSWHSGLPPGPIRRAAAKLRDWSAGRLEPSELPGIDARVATESLRMLYRIAKDG